MIERRERRARATLFIWPVSCLVVALLAAAPSRLDRSIDDGPIAVDVVQVPLNPRNRSQAGIGDFTYAGGITLASRQTNQLHGLSDLLVTADGHFAAVSDFGGFLQARVLLDSSARLAGLTDVSLAFLVGLDGRPLIAKSESDAEGLAILSTGDRLVSFEEHDRIWLYPRSGGPPRPAPVPNARFPFNQAMEALTADPDAGPDAYAVGIELTGEIWLCRLSAPACVPGERVSKPAEFGLVAMRRLPNALTAYLLRAYDDVRGSRVSLQLVRSGNTVARMDLARPLTVDNFEGLAAVPRPDGAIRFYLISDDNGGLSQRTLLMAFDWRSK